MQTRLRPRRVDKEYAKIFTEFFKISRDLWPHFHMKQCPERPFHTQFIRSGSNESLLYPTIKDSWKSYLKLLTEEQIYIIESGLDITCPVDCEYGCINKNSSLNVLNAVLWEYFKNMLNLFRSAGRVLFIGRTIYPNTHHDHLVMRSIADVRDLHNMNDSIRFIISIATETDAKYPVLLKSDVELAEIASQLDECDYEIYSLISKYIRKNKLELPKIIF